MSTAASSASVLCSLCFALNTAIPQAADKQLLWGDTHVHSSYSADSYLDGNFTVDPATAYRYAQGMPVVHPFHGARVRIQTPLDFLVVSDHAEFLGGIRQVHKFGIDTADMDILDKLLAWGAQRMFDYALADGRGMDAFAVFMDKPMDPQKRAAQLAADEALSLPGQAKIVTAAWREMVQTADAFNRPGVFSAIIGWEWTSTPGGANLHRVVLTDGAATSAARYLPFSRDDSPYPEDLWRWLEKVSALTGDNFVAIPHNANLSKGYMFPLESLRGETFSRRYLHLRRKWEPVVEVTQTKGDSETHPQLSTADAFADFERYRYYIQAQPMQYTPRPGDFVRSSLRRGLLIAASDGVNPYQFGLIGSTDSHTGLSSAEERNFLGEQPMDSIPANKSTGIGGTDSANGWDMSASGVAAVWAEDNTRQAILAALQRREVYATTGPRMRVQFTAHWETDSNVREVETKTRSGDTSPVRTDIVIPMGGTLSFPAPKNSIPTFSINAMKDPVGANLDRVQIIKGWVDVEGHEHERVFDVAWSGGREIDANGVLPRVGNTVDINRANYRNTIGAPTLTALWHDPQFKPQETAYYYARVLEIPTPRHSLFDAVALAQEPSTDHPTSIQERAYTSPIWYQPDG